MRNASSFQPNWASPPGETISEILASLNISEKEFASRIQLTSEAVSELLSGRISITLELARKLNRTLGASVEFWMSRDFQYQRATGQIQTNHLPVSEDWLTELPIGDMLDFGWITTQKRDFKPTAEVLSFFNVKDHAEWRQHYFALAKNLAFRTSGSFKSSTSSVAAWLRQGEILASRIDCHNWNPEQFYDALKNVRSLTRLRHPTKFIPRLVEICALSGVAVSVLRAPSGCRASGVARFLSKDKAQILLSMRHLTDDHFWFTFFHEAGHLLLPSERNLFFDEPEMSASQEEKEANEFALGILIPPDYQEEMMSLPLNHRAVIRYAVKIGIAPGIVVGQLQHFGIIKPNQLNKLKRKYVWS